MTQLLTAQEFKRKFPLLYEGDYKLMNVEERKELRRLPLIPKLEIIDNPFIFEAFDWAPSPQGRGYWNRVSRRIDEFRGEEE